MEYALKKDHKFYRQGRKVKINVYEDNRPLCQCHNEEDAQLLVAALNLYAASKDFDITMTEAKQNLMKEYHDFLGEDPSAARP